MFACYLLFINKINNKILINNDVCITISPLNGKLKKSLDKLMSRIFFTMWQNKSSLKPKIIFKMLEMYRSILKHHVSRFFVLNER